MNELKIKEFIQNTLAPKPQPSAWHTFVVPPDGKEVNRDTTGQRVAYYNIGDNIIIIPNAPPTRLFLINETISPIQIKGKGFSGRVAKLGKKNYLRFVNRGDKEEKIKARVTPS